MIDKKLYMSGAIKDYSKLVELGIKHVVNCRAEQHDDIALLTDLGISYYYIPLADADCGRFDQMETFVKITRMTEGPVLVHCMQGRGRAVLMASSYLIFNYNYTSEKALEKIKKDRPYIQPTGKQIEKLSNFRMWYDAL